MFSEFSQNSLVIIKKLSEFENISQDNFIKFINDYHNRIKKQIGYYKNKKGLSDYIMKSHDFLILLSLYEDTTPFNNKVEILLVFMYAYYKLDDFHFSTLDFNIKQFFSFIQNNEGIHSLIYKLVTDKSYLKSKV